MAYKFPESAYQWPTPGLNGVHVTLWGSKSMTIGRQRVGCDRGIELEDRNGSLGIAAD